MYSKLQTIFSRVGTAFGLASPQQPTLPPHPLTMTAAEGAGFFPARRGQLIGPNQRYEILRMLGAGRHSSVFLVRDVMESHAIPHRPLIAVKILTAFATEENHAGRLHELDTLRTLNEYIKAEFQDEPTPYLPKLRDNFEVSGPHGDHLCLVFIAQSISVNEFRRSTPSKTLRLHVVQLVVDVVVSALEEMHPAGIIHTDVQAGNILIRTADKEPDEPVIEGDITILGQKYTSILVPQPLPNDWRWDDDRLTAEMYGVILNDLGTAKWLGRETDYRIATPLALRAPEVIMQAGYDAKIDVWAVGCLAFELLTGHWCFHPEAIGGASVEEHHLAMMIALTGETFPQAMLERAKLRDKYFGPDGKLRVKVDTISLEQAIANYKVLRPDDIGPAAEFIRACLHLDPALRPTSAELGLHPWIQGGAMCADYREV